MRFLQSGFRGRHVSLSEMHHEKMMEQTSSAIKLKATTKLLAMFLILEILNVGTASAANLYADNYLGINGAYPTILAAMEKAQSGDTIWVSGVFTEGVHPKSGVTVRGLPGVVATIDGLGTQTYGVRFQEVTNAEVHDLLVTGCEYGIYVDLSSGINASGMTVQNSRTYGLNLHNSQNCAFTSCTFHNTLPGTEGDGFFVHGAATDDVDFFSCTFTQNARDGGQVYNSVSQTSAPQLTDVRFINCTSTANARQGLRTQGANGIDVIGGLYRDNGGSGIQIEQNTTDVFIDGVDAINNGNIKPGEKGIWIDEATYVTIQNCLLKDNPFGIGISQAHHLTISNCEIRDGVQKVAPPWGGISIHAGKHHHPINSPDYPGQPFGGTSNLTISNCTFENNGVHGVDDHSYGDVFYGDILGRLDPSDETPQTEMSFESNVLEGINGPMPGVNQIPFDPPQLWLQQLQISP